ncbi:SufE family protein [Lentisphaera marina]|uniref:SufE family protein n=1 Tax=Lentisphaera marina TaxID=1111041 RepID=UPI00236534BD|nr:SufE family protein [Lentisphaera marina]MDD7984781.1 SufE family protein [Lentisphaera marina]
MAIEDKDKLIADLGKIEDIDDRFTWLIKFGRQAGDLSEDKRIDKFKISGCTSQLWLVPELKAGQVHFSADSDAAIPKGLGTVFAKVYSGLTPAEAMALDASFLETAGLSEHLSMNRRNGLSSLHKQIMLYCATFSALAAQGIQDYAI